MLEQIARMRRGALSKQQSGRDQPVKRGVQFHLRLARNRSQQRVRKFPTDRGGDLRHVFRRAEPIEPRH